MADPVTSVQREHEERRLGVLARAILLLAVLVAYLPTLDGPFLWDDVPLIVEEPRAHSLRGALQSFVSPFWTARVDREATFSFYRPLVLVSYAVEFALHGENPTGFHVTNVLFHALNAQLLFSLLRRERAGVAVAASLAAAWALLPRLAECVAWISGRTDVLATTFVLGAMLVFRPERSLERPTHGRTGLAAGLLLGGLFCKEVTLAAMLALGAETLGPRASWPRTALAPASSPSAGAEPRARGLWTTRLGTVAILLAPLVVYIPLRRRALGGVGANLDVVLEVTRRLTLPLDALGTYVGMLVTPWCTNSQNGSPWTARGAYLALGAAVLVATLVAASFAHVRAFARRHAGPLVLFGVSLGLVLHIVPLAADIVAADRYLYVPTLALAWLGARHAALAASARAPRVLAAAAGLLALSFVPITFRRAEVWSDEIAFWDDMRKVAPERGRPYLHLGNIAYRAGLYPEARLYQEQALARAEAERRSGGGNPAPVLSNLGSCASMVGDYDAALRYFDAFAKNAPQMPIPHFLLALAHLHRLEFAEARRELEATLVRAPDFAAARSLHGRLPELERGVAKRLGPGAPDTAEDRVARARLEVELGRRIEAQKAWMRVVLDAEQPPSVRIEGAAYLTQYGDLDVAERAVEAVASVASPDVARTLEDKLHERRSVRARFAQLLGA